MHCADGVSDNDPAKSALQALQNEGQNYTYEQGLLKRAGAFDGYGAADWLVDLNDRNHLTTRAAGAVQGVGSAAVAAGAITGGCVTVAGCVLGVAVATGAVDYSKAGFTQLLSGDVAPTYGEQVLQGLGMSPYGAGLAYGAINLGAAAGGAVIVNQAGSDAAALNNAARLSYTPFDQFGARGMQVTPDVMKTAQAQAIVDAYTAAGLSLDKAEGYAAGLIQTGTSLPTALAVNADTELIKVVPKGTFGGDPVGNRSAYFMTRAEYDSLSQLPADQIAAKLGLPAEQAIRGSQLGFDVYSMKPHPGTDPAAFTSQIAPVQQGAYSAPGGAQQVLVPNRSQWTDPNANKIGEIRGSR